MVTTKVQTELIAADAKPSVTLSRISGAIYRSCV
jgi:hypothetical protein